MGQSGVISAIATPGSKLRSSKQVIEMDVEADGSKMIISNGYTKIETYNNDISFGAQHAQGVSHVKCVKRGHVTFGYSDIITTQLETRPRDKTFGLDENMRQLTTSGSTSSNELNVGLQEDRADERAAGDDKDQRPDAIPMDLDTSRPRNA